MIGGKGNDIFFVDNSGDVVTELAGEGIDLVYTNVNNYVLADNVENLAIIGDDALNVFGNSGDNEIWGNAARNVIKSGDGDDIIHSGGGNGNWFDGGAARIPITVAQAMTAMFSTASATRFWAKSRTAARIRSGPRSRSTCASRVPSKTCV